MTRNHLRHQAGGNPAQGPARDMANPTPSPTAGDDFPDQPTESDGPVQDQPDLDDFAARLGLGDADTPTDNAGDRSGGRATVEAIARRTAETARTTVSKVARGIGFATGRLRRLIDRTPDEPTTEADEER